MSETKNNSLSGKVFERLMVNCSVEKNNYNQQMWLCLCECGNETIVR